MTSVKGTFSYCGFGEDVGIDLTCNGPACKGLDGLPYTTCVTTAIGVHCSNTVKCDTNLWVTEFDYDLADTPNALVQQHHVTTIPECNYKFDVTANGKPNGFIFRNLTEADPACLKPIGLSSTNSTSGNQTTLPPYTPTPVSTSSAPQGLRIPYLLLLLVFASFFTTSLADTLELRAGITPATPPSLFPKTPAESWCNKFGLGNPITFRKRDIEARVIEFGKRAGLSERDATSLLTKFGKEALDRLEGWVAGKMFSYPRDPSIYKGCYTSEFVSSACTVTWDALFSRIGILSELVPACMTIVEGFALADAEPFSRIALTIYAGTMCNWLVAEAIPVIPCFESWFCDSLQNLFPATKCGGPEPAPAPPGTVFTYKTKNVPATDYRSGGSLLKNADKCGRFYNPVSSPFVAFCSTANLLHPQVRLRQM